MVQIIASGQLLRELEKGEVVIEFVDANGKRLGTLVRPPGEEDIQIAKARLAVNGKRFTTDEVVAHLRSLEQQ